MPACRRDALSEHGGSGGPVAARGRRSRPRSTRSPPARRCCGSWPRRWPPIPDMLRHGRAADRRAAGRRADRPRIGGPHHARLRALRPGRDAALPHAGRGHVQAVHAPGSARPPARTAARSSLSPAATPPGSGSASGAAAMTAGTAGAGSAARPPRSRCGPAAARRTSASTATGCPAPSAACAASTGNATSPRTGHPVCPSCSPRATALCARCGQDRPPQARWPEGPVCDPCYTAALRRRVPCASCGQLRRLVSPPGPDADTCASCAGQPVTCACTDCGIEDKLYERGRCERCSLRRRAAVLLSAGPGDVPAALTACSRRSARPARPNPRSTGCAAAAAPDPRRLAAGRLAATHEALDLHPRPGPPSHLRHMLVAGGVLPPRDEELARTEQWLTALLASVDDPGHRRLVQAFATWHVMRRLRRSRRGQAAAPDIYRGSPEHDQSSRRGSSAGSARAAPRCPAAARAISTTGWPPGPVRAASASS